MTETNNFIVIKIDINNTHIETQVQCYYGSEPLI